MEEKRRFAIVHWEDKLTSIINLEDIKHPKKPFTDYRDGDYVVALFHKKAFKARLSQISDNKSDLMAEKNKNDEFPLQFTYEEHDTHDKKANSGDTHLASKKTSIRKIDDVVDVSYNVEPSVETTISGPPIGVPPPGLHHMTQHSSPRMTPHPRPGMTAYLGDTTQMITKTTSISTPTISDENNNGTFGVKRTLSGKCSEASEASESQSNMKKTRTETEASTTSGSQVKTTVHMPSISSQSRKLEKKIADLEKETHKLKKRVKDLEQRASTSSCVESTPADTIEDQDKQLKALLALVDEWPRVKFFKRNKKLWTLNAVKHSVLETDVMKKTAAPPDKLLC
ncbi:hypothetical protein DPMN_006012 [Dreissena polymorpha]|uniref:Uncharacterized protein n=1 Tax=Dreissena polymorpha TaxID=45954 RepID=A0A9D4MT85_DREPO|nr:hypothetical protein DPMN_006012 [Dreissena polymorpha]